MELRVEAAEGCAMPPGCYICVRVGEVQRQNRYDPRKGFRFPGAVQRRRAKIDVFRRVGTCELDVDPDLPGIKEAKVAAAEPGLGHLRLKVNVQQAEPEGQQLKTQKAMKSAKSYLADHNVEMLLSSAVRSLLSDRPEDPKEYLTYYVREGCPPPKGAKLPAEPVNEPPPPSEPVDEPLPEGPAMDALRHTVEEIHPGAVPQEKLAGPDAAAVRAKARKSLEKGVEDGSLEQLLPTAASQATPASQPPAPAAPPEPAPNCAPDADSVRLKARKSLDKGIQDGGLEKLLQKDAAEPPAAEAPVASQPPDAAAVRAKARKSLDKGVNDGELEKLLKGQSSAAETPAEPLTESPAPNTAPDPAAVRAKARKSLDKGVNDGELEKLLKNQPGATPAASGAPASETPASSPSPDPEAVRAKARKSLDKGANDGELEKLLKS